MEKYDWINNVHIYFVILERINKQFKKLLKTMEHDEIEENFFYLSVELLRFVPFEENKKDSILSLLKNDGICLLRRNINFIMNDLDKILQENAETFRKVKHIRNKYEHEPHNVSGAFSTGHSSFSAMGFYCRDVLITLDTMELTYIIYDLNRMMDKIEKIVDQIKIEHKEELSQFNIHYIESIKKIKIIDYNKGYTRIPKQMIM